MSKARDYSGGPGLEFIKSQNFTSLNAIPVTSIFSSKYDSYRIIIDAQSNTTGNNDIVGAFMIGNSLPSKTYYWSGHYTLINSGPSRTSNGGAGYFYMGAIGNNGRSTIISDIINPYAATNTNILSQSTAWTNADINTVYTGSHENSGTQFDGIYFYVASSNVITGKITVYGYRKQ